MNDNWCLAFTSLPLFSPGEFYLNLQNKRKDTDKYFKSRFQIDTVRSPFPEAIVS